MRDFVLMYVNGRRHEVRGREVFLSLSDFLRREQALVGTKIVCEEGDCGACTVLIGRPAGERIDYQPVNSCIQFVHQLDGAHVVTVEGLKLNGLLHPVQEAMVRCHGSQCGFCTPGFVVAMAGLFEGDQRPDESCVRHGLSGNLCRCTGYVPIIKAALEVEPAKVSKISELYPPEDMLADLAKHRDQAIDVTCDNLRYLGPTAMTDAAALKAQHPDAVIVAGATDVGVQTNKRRIAPKTFIGLANIPGLADVTLVNGEIVAGARASWSAIEEFSREHLPEFHKIVALFGSPQIRNVGTIGGNIANASPIADSLPLLFAMEARLEIVGPTGTRVAPINGFYKGYKNLDVQPGELIARIFIPLPRENDGETLRLYKVSKRRDLDISTFTAAIWAKRTGDTLQQCRIAYGGVAPTVVRLPKTEAFLTGKELTEAVMAEAGKLARTEITPISDVRGSKEFRWQLAENILMKFYFDCVENEAAV